ncbi:hypothetical protein [Mycobacterium genavense]|uniref:hypothetical protein n=1 Tax=Mycobacterium genavense TaxID=36812 RepID=UPI00146FC24A|nr:hypothetical protein [Mycobacterium genavense]
MDPRLSFKPRLLRTEDGGHHELAVFVVGARGGGGAAAVPAVDPEGAATMSTGMKIHGYASVTLTAVNIVGTPNTVAQNGCRCTQLCRPDSSSSNPHHGHQWLVIWPFHRQLGLIGVGYSLDGFRQLRQALGELPDLGVLGFGSELAEALIGLARFLPRINHVGEATPGH